MPAGVVQQAGDHAITIAPKLSGQFDDVRTQPLFIWLTTGNLALRRTMLPGGFLDAKMQQHWSDVSRAYHPDAYDGMICLCEARAEGFADAMILATDPLFGWERLVKGGIQLRKIEAGHPDMLRPPAAHDLAELLEADIDASLASSSR